MASITLPRPSRKGNLANVVTSKPVKVGPRVADKRGRRDKRKREARVSIMARTCETRPAVLAGGQLKLLGYMIEFSGSKACTNQ